MGDMSNLSRTSALYLPPAVSLIQDAYVRRSEVEINPLLVLQVGVLDRDAIR